jgi:hypothetical protein
LPSPSALRDRDVEFPHRTSGLQLKHLVKTAMHIEQNFNMTAAGERIFPSVDNTTSIQNTSTSSYTEHSA